MLQESECLVLLSRTLKIVLLVRKWLNSPMCEQRHGYRKR